MSKNSTPVFSGSEHKKLINNISLIQRVQKLESELEYMKTEVRKKADKTVEWRKTEKITEPKVV